MVRMLFKVKIFFTIIFLSVVWLLPTKTAAQGPMLAESTFANAVDDILDNSCLRKQNFGIKTKAVPLVLYPKILL